MFFLRAKKLIKFKNIYKNLKISKNNKIYRLDIKMDKL